MEVVKIKRQAYKLLEDAIDTHIHVNPDLKERLLGGFEAAEEAKEAGMKAIVIKSHYTMSIVQANIVSDAITGIDVFGGITLNQSVGGFNPAGVEVAIKYGAKIVWMPTVSAKCNLMNKGKDFSKGLSVFNEKKGEQSKLRPEVIEILDLIAKGNIILATSHISFEETLALIKECNRIGVKKILINHPQNVYASMDIQRQKEIVEMGAYLEHCFNLCTPHLPIIHADDFAKSILTLGPDHCVMATDMGQLDNFKPTEGLRVFIQMMLDRGVKSDWIKKMVQDNPVKLLY